MAQTIRLKRSATPGQVPTTGQLALGELAINTADGRMFFKKDDGSVNVMEISTTLYSATASASSVTASSTEPAVKEAGDLWYDTADKVLRAWDGTRWVSVGDPYFGGTAPASPNNGEFWYDTNNNTLKMYDGTRWTAVHRSVRSTPPSNPQLGDTYFDTDDNTEYYWSGTAWVQGTITRGTSASRPAAGQKTGELYYDTDLNKLYMWNGTRWASVGGADVSATAPSPAAQGDMWYDTVNDIMKIYDGFSWIASGGNDLFVKNNTILGDDPQTDTLFVNAAASLNGSVTIKNGETLTFDSNAFTNAHKFTVRNAAGTVLLGGWLLDTDSNAAN